MRLTALAIRQLPGVDAFTVDGLAPGVNLVVGPNAVGKSSLARALWHLVAGSRPADPSALSLEAELVDDDGHWRVVRSGRQVVWTRDGEPAAVPPLPEADRLHCYWLRVEDLLQAEGRDEQSLVELLRRELAAGFDLDAVRNAFEFGPRRGQQEGQALRDARQQRQRIESRYEALLREEETLPRLEARVQAARAAGQRARQLEQALALLEARQERERLDAALASHPEGMERLTGRELQRLHELEAQRGRARDGAAEQRRRRDEARARAAETGLADARPEASELEATARRLQTLIQRDRQREEARRRLAEREAEWRAAAEALGGDDAALITAGPAEVAAAERLAQDLHAARAELDACRAQAQAAAEPAGDGPRPTRLPWIAGLALASAVLGGVAAVLTALWWAIAASLLAALATGLAVPAAWREQRSHREAESERDFARRRHRELADRVAAAEAREQAAREAAREFCQAHGIDPAGLAGAGLDRLIRLTAALDQARSAHAAARAELDRIDAELQAEATAVHGFLAQWGAAPETSDPVALETALDAFRERWRAAEQAARDGGEADRELRRLEETVAERAAEIGTLYREAGIEPGDRAGLERRCAALETWRELRRQHDAACATEAERRRPLAGEDDLLARVEAGDAAGLEADLSEQQTLAADYESLLEEAKAIRTRLEEAGRDGGLEQALAAERGAAEALAGLRDEALLGAAGRFLLDQVAGEYRSARQPPVLQDASERFLRFTHHGWSLELDAERGFHAREAASGERRPLSALSSGTRMQLLLAVRIAWARQIEREKKPLPLFLDEALTTSDTGRFAEVAASLQQLADEEGRQIFYLSARREEIGLWEHATGKAPAVVDLAAIRFRRPTAAPVDYQVPEPAPLPAPDARTPEAYAAALGVPAPDPWQPPEAIPLFHLLRDDLPQLHRLMEDWRVTRLGELEALLAGAAAERALPDRDVRERLAARCRIARSWLGHWRRGRGRPVDRGVLEASGVIRETFIDRVSELADRVGGDAEALVSALREGQVKRFRGQTTDELEAWLQAEGYLDPEPPLEPEALLRAVLASQADTAHPAEIRRLVTWLQAALPHAGAATAVTAD
ncbi:hypothetical protein [Sediminicurvatus halobius]|uniref:Rad50/SbcC-type AAA domain-containing protein n=1 Tax=Sediminicurvatus halobius TaxID=2182432 RepID=A0A2U2MZD0_9GAMM|nr:hypothetical protein [Spiribacter halobius]PWG62345.1 hypothetical protein DEM34_12790 [Spiribacter halobius]UEX79732.1 hypothetical protein LMH63_08830 [Spiribacter halobius]